MTAPVSVDAAAFLREYLESASPDLLRAMVKSFAEALMSGDADALCGAPYGNVATSARISADALENLFACRRLVNFMDADLHNLAG